MKKEDLRITKTKKSLYRGLLKLMEKKTLDSIKVSDICTISKINRSTFYDHYNDKYELFKELINSLQTDLKKHIKVDKETNTAKDYYLEIMKLLLKQLDKQKALFSSIVNNNYNTIAYEMLKEIVVKSVIEHIEENYENTTNTPINIIVMYYVIGPIDICIESLKNKKEFNSEILLEQFKEIAPELEFLKLKK